MVDQITAGEFHEMLRLRYYEPGGKLKQHLLRDTEERSAEIEFTRTSSSEESFWLHNSAFNFSKPARLFCKLTLASWLDK